MSFLFLFLKFFAKYIYPCIDDDHSPVAEEAGGAVEVGTVIPATGSVSSTAVPELGETVTFFMNHSHFIPFVCSRSMFILQLV